MWLTIWLLQRFEVTRPIWDNVAIVCNRNVKYESRSLDGATQKSGSATATANNHDLLCQTASLMKERLRLPRPR